MRVSKPILASHRAALLDTGAALFRARGIGQVSVAEVCRGAGLTHGAFYGHFPSKDALAAEACRSALGAAAERWRAQAGPQAAARIIDAYLTEQHRDAPGGGCVLATLAAEAARGGPALEGAVAEGAAALLDALTDALGGDAARAGAVLATMLGGLMLARALRCDPARSRAVLADAAAAAHRLAAEPVPEPADAVA